MKFHIARWTIIGAIVLALGLLGGILLWHENAFHRTQDNLKRLGVAMHDCLDTYKRLPTGTGAAYPGMSKAAGLSWRVHLLPFLGQDALYKQFDLNEPWDGPHNKPLHYRMPAVFGTPGFMAPIGYTHYRVFVNDGLFPKGGSVGLSGLADGTTNTIMVAEGAEPVPWTKPDELVYERGKPLPALAKRQFGTKYVLLMADATVALPSTQLDEGTLRLLMDPSDGQSLPQGWAPGR